MDVFGFSLSPVLAKAARSLAPLLLLALLTVGGAVATSVLLRDPAQAHVAQAQAAYEAARLAGTRQEAAKETLEELSGFWKELPVRKEFSVVLLAISELAQQDHVAIPGMHYTFQKVEDGLAWKSSMTFQAAGDYADIRRFIHRLETSGPYLFIESLDATRVIRGEQPSRVMFNVRVVTFLRPDPVGTEGKA
jgi:hypothetical protein